MDVPRQAHAVEHSPTDVPDNRPLSGRLVGRSLFLEYKRQLVNERRERLPVDDEVGSGRGDDDVAMNGDSLYRSGNIQRRYDRGASASRHTRTVASSLPLMMTRVPSGSAPTATAPTGPSWPRSGSPTGVPSASRHTRTVASLPPLTMTGVQRADRW